MLLKIQRLSLLVFAAIWGSCVGANEVTLSSKSLNQTDTQLNATTQQENQQKAAEWGLTVDEWARYTELMAGERGVWSPNLDPLTALGIEARTISEKERYARMLAKRFYERVQKELEFDRIYRQEFAKLYPAELPFVIEPHISQSAGRVIYFTRFDDCDACQTDIGRILRYANNQTPIDIFVVGSVSDDDIRLWAKKHQIDPMKVQQRLITLNHDNGYWMKYSLGKMPAAYQIKGDGQWQPLVY